jgi:hypothetical protein
MAGRNIRQGASVIATGMMHVYHDSSRFPYGFHRSMGSTSGMKKQKQCQKEKGAQHAYKIVHDQFLSFLLCKHFIYTPKLID